MLTLTKTKRSRIPMASITLPPDTPTNEVARFGRLSCVFGGRIAGTAYLFTAARGRKCWALYEGGFDAREQRSKFDRYCITHPTFKRHVSTTDAVAMAALSAQKEVWA